jgi:hypothetical protein
MNVIIGNRVGESKLRLFQVHKLNGLGEIGRKPGEAFNDLSVAVWEEQKVTCLSSTPGGAIMPSAGFNVCKVQAGV